MMSSNHSSEPAPPALDCAWCLKERGIAPDPRDSHGICAEHDAQMRAQSAARRALRLANTKNVA